MAVIGCDLESIELALGSANKNFRSRDSIFSIFSIWSSIFSFQKTDLIKQVRTTNLPSLLIWKMESNGKLGFITIFLPESLVRDPIGSTNPPLRVQK